MFVYVDGLFALCCVCCCLLCELVWWWVACGVFDLCCVRGLCRLCVGAVWFGLLCCL